MTGYATGIGQWDTCAGSPWPGEGASMVAGQARNGASTRAYTPAAAERALAGARWGPTAVRIALGAQLRRLRETTNITREEAAEAIRAKQRDVADLLSLYGVSDETEREELLALARQADAPGWWRQYTDILPRWFEFYVGLERAASVIRSYEVQFVHGLMQTEDYARAVVLIANAHAPAAETDRRVSVRMRRQQLLTQPGAPELWAVLDEAALRRPVGGPTVMRAQLRHLLEVIELPNVTLQIVPFRAGAHAAAGGPFTILRFPGPDVPDVVYLEQLNSALYLDQPDAVIDYMTVMNQLCVQAETGTVSRDMLGALLKQA